MDGSSWDNAATIQQISDQVSLAGAGGEVLLRADQGAYNLTAPIDIHAGGLAGQAVTVRGVDGTGAAMAAEIVGTRPDPWTAVDPKGSEAFDLTKGADHLSFSDLSFKNLGNGAFKVLSDIADLSIDKVTATNVTTFLQGYDTSGIGGSITGLHVSNVNVTGYSTGAISLGFNTSNVTIENVVADSQRQHVGTHVTGIHLDGTTHDVVIRNVTVSNNYGAGSARSYWNGDGFATEGGVYNVTFDHTVATGNTDGGYDLKSTNTLLTHAYAEGNKDNYRIWSDSVTVVDSTSANPQKSGGSGGESHIWLVQGADAYFDNLTIIDAAGTRQLAELQPGATTLYISDSDPSIAATYASHLNLGSGTAIVYNTGPSGLVLSSDAVKETATAGTVVGKLSTVDPDVGDPHTYTLLNPSSSFEIVGDELRVKAGAVLDHDLTPTQSLAIQVMDQGHVTYDQTFQVSILDAVKGVTINGTAGADLIDATHTVAGQPLPTAGADVIDGGAGADVMQGGAGDDTYFVDNAGDQVVEQAGEGTDLVKAGVSYTLGANQENLTLTGHYSLSGFGNDLDNRLIGNSTGNYLSGGAGNDWLDGGANGDLMVGGTGDDTYVVDHARDRVVEDAGAGNDTVRTSVNFTLPANVETLIGTGSAALSLTGNGLANTIAGNGADNTLNGGAGADTLTGGAGADTFVFKPGEASGDVITDFTGAGAAAGDSLRFEGFGQGTITKVDGQTDLYQVTAASGGASELIRLLGVSDLDLHTGAGHNDIVFA
jgi:serralysin